MGRDRIYLRATGASLMATITLRFEILTEVPQVAACEELGRVSRIFVSAHDRTRVHNVRVTQGERRCLVVEYRGAIPPGRTIAQVRWDQAGSGVGLSGGSIVGTAAQVTMDAGSPTFSPIRCTAVFDNGEAYTQVIMVEVVPGPSWGGSSGGLVVTA